jgi:putative modified peptide
MTEGGSGGGGYMDEFSIPPDRAQELLERLAIDFNYRQLLESNPVAALAEYGIEISRDKLPDVIDLPAPHQILRVLAVMQEQDVLTPDRTLYVIFMWILPSASPIVSPEEGDAAG